MKIYFWYTRFVKKVKKKKKNTFLFTDRQKKSWRLLHTLYSLQTHACSTAFCTLYVSHRFRRYSRISSSRVYLYVPACEIYVRLNSKNRKTHQTSPQQDKFLLMLWFSELHDFMTSTKPKFSFSQRTHYCYCSSGVCTASKLSKIIHSVMPNGKHLTPFFMEMLL